MGASSSSEDGHTPCQVTDPNFRFLMGQVKNLAPAAQRLFNLGRFYLSSDDPEHIDRDRSEFNNLFPTFGEQQVAQNTGADRAFKLFRPLKKSKSIYHGQTYVQWKIGHDYQSAYVLCMQKRTIIYIQPIDEFPDFVKEFRFRRGMIKVGLFELVQGFAQIFFSGIDVMILPGVKMEEEGWDIASRYHQITGQKQYLVQDFFPKLQSRLPHNGVCVLGFIWTDLFPENYNFVLGEASPKHKSGIFCFGRFPPSTFDANNLQDLTEVTGELVWKIIKTVSHEVCHLFGLDHCEFFFCAMNESSTVAQAMAQPLFLCPVCLRKLHQVCGFDVVERYQELLSLLRDVQAQLPCGSISSAVQWLEECLAFLQS